MSVVDKKQWQLYEMLKRLLELDINNSNLSALESYNEVVLKIDSELFNSITDMINKNIGYIDEPLEEQLKFLKKLDHAFLEYDSFRQEVVTVFKKYSYSNDNLSDISSIRIDEIRERIEAIKKYLANESRVQKHRLELDALNKELIDAMKQSEVFEARMRELDDMLERRLSEAKGVKTMPDGSIHEITFLDEVANAIDTSDAKKKSSSKLIDGKVKEFELKIIEVSESLKAAQICYDKNPSTSEQAYLSIMNESVLINYKLVVLKIMQLVKKRYISYEEAYDKRATLKKLIEDREKLLEQLGLSNSFDLQASLGLNEQLELMQVYGDNCKKISELREKIDKKSNSYSLLVDENDNLLSTIDVYIDFLGNNDVSSAYDKLPNQVIRVTTPISFNFDGASEKTSEVMERIAKGYDIHAEKYSVSPELEVDEDNSMFIQDNPFDEEPDLFDDQSNNAFVDDKTSDDIFTSSVPFEAVADDTSSDLFADYSSSAFVGPTLFNDKQDGDTIFEPVNNNETQVNAEVANSLDQDTMAGSFWPSFG